MIENIENGSGFLAVSSLMLSIFHLFLNGKSKSQWFLWKILKFLMLDPFQFIFDRLRFRIDSDKSANDIFDMGF